MRTKSLIIINKTTLAGTTPVTSTIVPMDAVYSYCLQTIVAGASIAGSFQLYGSCEEGGDQGQGVTAWAPIDSAVTLTTAGSTLINKDGIAYRWFKVVFTPASGTGTLTLVLSTKG